MLVSIAVGWCTELSDHRYSSFAQCQRSWLDWHRLIPSQRIPLPLHEQRREYTRTNKHRDRVSSTICNAYILKHLQKLMI